MLSRGWQQSNRIVFTSASFLRTAKLTGQATKTLRAERMTQHVWLDCDPGEQGSRAEPNLQQLSTATFLPPSIDDLARDLWISMGALPEAKNWATTTEQCERADRLGPSLYACDMCNAVQGMMMRSQSCLQPRTPPSPCSASAPLRATRASKRPPPTRSRRCTPSGAKCPCTEARHSH